MKTRLYKLFIKRVCKEFKLTKQQLFNRQFKFSEKLVFCYKYNFDTCRLEKLNTIVLWSCRNPLSQLYNSIDMHTVWLLKYWRHSHWKPYIQMKIDIGIDEKEAIHQIVKNKLS